MCTIIAVISGNNTCKIATSYNSRRICSCKSKGLASKVFYNGLLILKLPGFIRLGHFRYPTSGTSSNAETQRFYVSSASPYTDSDSEIMLQVFASQLLQTDKRHVEPDDLFTGLSNMFKIIVGGFAFCGMVGGTAIFGSRDPHGIRPLVIGSRPNPYGKGMDYMLASESVPLDELGFSGVQDLQPGQAPIIPKRGSPVFRQVHPHLSHAPNIFDYCYFSRPDSSHRWYSRFRKNHYVFQTFIMPVKGNALRGFSQNSMLCEASSAEKPGANKVYFACSAPPVTHPHIYGIDLTTSWELVAHNPDRKAIAASINADEVIFLSLEDLEAACAELSPRPSQRFEDGVFSGNYATPLSPGYPENLAKARGKPKSAERHHNSTFVTVGDSVTRRLTGYEASDISLHHVTSDLP
ncbi:nucleophile aminohydrolase [Xylariaceae sp. FL1272]|nr:nucleophile aminohydrolase [Xylariaceae sp. FL1272]